MFTPQGPSLRELTVQALSSVEHGYDLLADKFDATPFRTSDRLLTAVGRTLETLGPFDTGLDVCCGTGAGLDVLRSVCAGRITGVDFSTGMLTRAREAHPTADLVRADALALPFGPVFDLAVSFGAFGHFLPAAQRTLFAQVHASLRPGGTFAFPLPAPPPVGSRLYWILWGFDAAMRVRNTVWRPPFVMYYRTFRLPDVRARLEEAGFHVSLTPVETLGRRDDGSPHCRLVVARKG
ncbi:MULTISPECIES: class I SAM-dependent methyltransferase [Streptomyces]|uniref:Methyltransferase n=4 Tax=Streptomyces venezuelae TaxID=54571 RepID=F2REY2_STRVP|nr:class I SAM-dependent methyltransferase [Streptomyces venezuelae]APE25111.1 SAM-dependent methyltransferase [Streptomyces venezuelae]QES02454.1 class I SAM-dependent methyltransferase [Streptomyces venezuelae ATCC 10712]QES11904.1 class I SAM-dependent methyltransferase [Streptomyces venezuelae]CCA59667.1 methyltransferase [Streptomyces venezuelae ATCC 10712]